MDYLKSKFEEIVSWIKGQGPKQEERSTVGKWAISIIVSLLSLFALGFAAYQQVKMSSELAKLKHDKDVQNELIAQNRALVKLKELEEKSRQARLAYAKSVEEGIAIDLRIADLEHKTKILKDKVENVKTWDDLDKLNSNSNTN